MKYLIWMNCYGSWAPHLRREIETLGYDHYLDDTVQFIAKIADRVEAFYISGGMYDADGKTECETTKPELLKRFNKVGVDLQIQTDEGCFTSTAIMKKFLTTWRKEYLDCSPIIIVDKARLAVNQYVFDYFCHQLSIENLSANEVVVSFERLDDHPNSQPLAQEQKLKILKEIGVEAVDKLELEARKEHIELHKKRATSKRQ